MKIKGRFLIQLVNSYISPVSSKTPASHPLNAKIKNLKLLTVPIFTTIFLLMFVVNLTLAAPKISSSAKPSPSPASTSWRGNGTTNGACSNIGNFDDLNPDPGKQGWIFILTSPYTTGQYTLTYSFIDGPSASTIPSKIVGSIHFIVYTAIGATLESASVTNGTTNSVLTVSHCEINVLPLEIFKTADTSFTRTWTWDIEKSADQTDLGTLQPEDVATANYTATVSATSQDSDFAISGNITITNPAGNPTANITNVTDTLDVSGSVVVNCPGGLTQSLAGGATLICTYTANVADQSDSLNTATVTTSGLVPGGSANANVDWDSAAITKVDDCITVNDTNPNGPQNVQVCEGDLDQNGQKTFDYSVTFSRDGEADVSLACGEHTFENTVSFVTNDTEITGDDSWTVIANVECNTFWCSPGFWGSAAKFDIYEYINDNKVVTPPPTISGGYFYSSITGITPAPLKAGSPPNPTLADVLGSSSTYGGPAFNSIADYFAYLLGWGGTQETGDNCPINAHGILIE